MTRKAKKAGSPKTLRTPKSKRIPTTPQEPKRKIGYTLNWKRAIYINKTIDDNLVKELTPTILQLKQASSDPITVGIDSPGGKLESMDAILSLLKCPDQDGKIIDIYTVATNRAYSAAASFLAFGDYAVGFPHSSILYHDVRYSEIEDVTPSKALQTARNLERGNAAFSLKLANKIQKRLIWVYLDLKPSFDDVRKRWPEFASKYDDVFNELLPKDQPRIIDVVGLSLALYSKLSRDSDQKIAVHALNLLDSWMQIERIEQKYPDGDPKKEGNSDFTKGLSDLVSAIRSMDKRRASPSEVPEVPPETGLDESMRNDIRLLLEVLARRLALDKNSSINGNWLDTVMEDFSFMKDIKGRGHIQTTTRMMVNHAHAFFEDSVVEQVRSAKTDEERNVILAPFYPQARIFWYYIVLICRCLCRGDHFLTPYDAQLLGLVDEVLGGGFIQSRREWRKTRPEFEQTRP